MCVDEVAGTNLADVFTEKENSMNLVTLPGATALVTNNLSRFLARLDRPALAAVAQAAIDRLDEIDGDPDLEEDDPAGQSDEDGMNTGAGRFFLHGVQHSDPGCPISDSGFVDCGDDSITTLAIATGSAAASRRRLTGTLRLNLGATQ